MAKRVQWTETRRAGVFSGPKQFVLQIRRTFCHKLVGHQKMCTFSMRSPSRKENRNSFNFKYTGIHVLVDSFWPSYHNGYLTSTT